MTTNRERPTNGESNRQHHPANEAPRPRRRILSQRPRSTTRDRAKLAAPVQFVSIARIVAPHAIHGELKAEILTDFPERFSRLKQVYVGPAHRPFAVQSTRRHQRHVLLKLAEVNTIEDAEALRGLLVEVPLGEAVPLAEAEYYWHDVIGLEVQTNDGRVLGRVADILRTGSNDVYVVRADRQEILIPAIEDVVKEIDVAHGRMLIEPMPGLLE